MTGKLVVSATAAAGTRGGGVMANKLDAVSRHLYRALLRRCSILDSNPAVKALVQRSLDDEAHSAGLREALEVFLGSSARRLYLPRPNAQPAGTIVKKAFRFPHESVDSDTAFEALRFVNNSIQTARKNGILPVNGERAGNDGGVGEAAGEGAESGESEGTAEVVDGPRRGVVLISHPLLGGFFQRSVILLAEHSSKGTRGLTVNIPINIKLRALYNKGSKFAAGLSRENKKEGKKAAEPSDSGAEGASHGRGGGGSTMSQTINYFVDNWVSLGGPVPGDKLTVVHNRTDLGGVKVIPGDSEAAAAATETSAVDAGEESHQGASTASDSEDEEGFGHGVWVSRSPRRCMERAMQRGYPQSSLRLFAGQCTWESGQLAGEISRGLWVTARASPELLDILESQREATAPEWAHHDMQWCNEQRHRSWARVMAALGGEYAYLARMPVSVMELWDDY